MITRRGFLASILAAASAPAIVRASSIMRVRSVLAGPGVGDTIWVADWNTPFMVTGARAYPTIDEIMRDSMLKLRDAIDNDMLRAISGEPIWCSTAGDDLHIVRPH